MPIGPPGVSGSAALSGVTVTGTAAASQVPVASSATAGVWAYPPGFEINYTQITSPVNIASTTEATGTTIISPGAITFDGTPVLVQFFAPYVVTSSAAVDTALVVSIFEGATQIGRLCRFDSQTTTAVVLESLTGFYRFTPTAASHTYTITAYVGSTTGTPQIGAGAAGTGAAVPAFVRFTKV